jgi:hypothetical protein
MRGGLGRGLKCPADGTPVFDNFFRVFRKQCNEDYKCSSALSKSTSRQIYSVAKRPTEHVSAGTHITHVPCPCHCADAIVPVHRAHQIMPATSCPCNCSHARGCAIVPVPMCLRQGHRDCAIVPAPFARTIVPPAPSRPGHCSITSDTHAVNIASVTYPLMLQPRWCRYRLY